MAYISTDDVRTIRNTLKAKYPVKDGWKFSVRGHNKTSVTVSIMKAPVRFTPRHLAYEVPQEHFGINHHHVDRNYDNDDILKDIIWIINNAGKVNYDNSDLMTDYHDVGFYVHLEVGQWDKPFEFIGDEDEYNTRMAINKIVNWLKEAHESDLKRFASYQLAGSDPQMREHMLDHILK